MSSDRRDFLKTSLAAGAAGTASPLHSAQPGLQAAMSAAKPQPSPLSDFAMLRWLYERARIGDVLHKFAFFLDTKQWQNYIDLFAEDGAIELPWGLVTRQMLQQAGGPRMLMSLHATHHISTNHQIDVDGTNARSRSHLLATHVADPDDRKELWVVGGWYDNDYHLTDGLWRIVKSKLKIVWETGVRPK